MDLNLTCPKCSATNKYNIVQRGVHNTAYCDICGSYIRNLPQGRPLTFHFGKYKGTALADMKSPDEINYLHWILSSDMNNTIKTKVVEHLKTLEQNG